MATTSVVGRVAAIAALIGADQVVVSGGVGRSSAACTAASCDVASLRGSAPTAFGFHAAAIHVRAGLTV